MEVRARRRRRPRRHWHATHANNLVIFVIYLQRESCFSRTLHNTNCITFAVVGCASPSCTHLARAHRYRVSHTLRPHTTLPQQHRRGHRAMIESCLCACITPEAHYHLVLCCFVPRRGCRGCRTAHNNALSDGKCDLNQPVRTAVRRKKNPKQNRQRINTARNAARQFANVYASICVANARALCTPLPSSLSRLDIDCALVACVRATPYHMPPRFVIVLCVVGTLWSNDIIVQWRQCVARASQKTAHIAARWLLLLVLCAGGVGACMLACFIASHMHALQCCTKCRRMDWPGFAMVRTRNAMHILGCANVFVYTLSRSTKMHMLMKLLTMQYR